MHLLKFLRPSRCRCDLPGVVAVMVAFSLLTFVACGSDSGDATPSDVSGGDTNSDVAPDGADADDTPDVPPLPEPEPRPADVTFTLINGNPGGLSRWVEVRTATGAPGWWGIVEDGLAGDELRAHANCNLCDCDGTCRDCPEAQVLELGPSDQVSALWDLSLFEISAEDGAPCQAQVDADAARYRVQFCWSPEPPNEQGGLPPGTLSCTRLPFVLGVDTEVTYAIEALSTCGDGVCDPGETSASCPSDCTGINATDVVIACSRQCVARGRCDQEFNASGCEADTCVGLGAAMEGATSVCLEAVEAELLCSARLECDDLARHVMGQGGPCDEATAAVESACGGAAQ